VRRIGQNTPEKRTIGVKSRRWPRSSHTRAKQYERGIRAATVSVMSERESAGVVEEASLEVSPAVADTMRSAGSHDERLDAGHVTHAARLAVAAWLQAVDGDGTALTAMAEPDAEHWLLHPVRKNWQVATGPSVTQIRIWELEAGADPPRLSLTFQFTGHRQLTDSSPADLGPADPSPADPSPADPSPANRTGAEETVFAGLLRLVLQGTGRWRLASGHVQTLDEFLGYTFTSREETPGEYAERTGSLDPPQAAGPVRRFRLTAGFFEHDVRFGSSVTIEVQREAAPARDEAAQLVWPAIEQETARALGAGDWRPSLSSLTVVELLGG
jgi:hypothetical protein